MNWDVILQGVQKKWTKETGYNFSCVGSFLMKFGYVLDMGNKFFHKKFKRSILKNDISIAKKLFFQRSAYNYCFRLTVTKSYSPFLLSRFFWHTLYYKALYSYS